MQTERMMKHIGIIILAALSLAACSKTVAEGSIEGRWMEKYDDPFFVMEGSLQYIFDGQDGYRLITYDVFSGQTVERTGHYTLHLFGKNTITISPDGSDSPGSTYSIVKLTDSEMAWQLEGTTFARGTMGHDYRHFVKVK